MKNSLITILAFISLSLASASIQAQVPSNMATVNLLSGDQKLACEAMLCLSSPTQEASCQPSIARYYNITRKSASATQAARRDFLNLCPLVNETPNQNGLQLR